MGKHLHPLEVNMCFLRMTARPGTLKSETDRFACRAKINKY